MIEITFFWEKHTLPFNKNEHSKTSWEYFLKIAEDFNDKIKPVLCAMGDIQVM